MADEDGNGDTDWMGMMVNNIERCENLMVNFRES